MTARLETIIITGFLARAEFVAGTVLAVDGGYVHAC